MAMCSRANIVGTYAFRLLQRHPLRSALLMASLAYLLQVQIRRVHNVQELARGHVHVPVRTATHTFPHHNAGARIYTEFTAASAFRYPVLFLTLLGYDNDNGSGYPSPKGDTERMNSTNTTNNGPPLAKFVFLGNGTESGNKNSNGNSDGMDPSLLSPLLRKDAKVTQDEEWNVVYTLDVEVPPWAANLTFILSWRLEYSSYTDAIADYPTKVCSFQGAPNGSIVLSKVKQVERDQPNDKGLLYSQSHSHRHRPSWLQRESINVNSEWTYYENQDDSDENKSMLCEPWNEKRSYSVLIVGDSQPNYMCERLAKYGSTPTRCVALKGQFTNGSRTELRDFSKGYSGVLNQAQEDVVIFNTQGLWETAYGQFALFPSRLDTVLNSTPTRTKQRIYFFLTTTAVHPINYKPGIFSDEKKWSMTQPRVQAINSASRERIHASSNNNKDIFVIDVEALSLLREDDPMMKGDMRHYGHRTNELLLSYVLCEVDKRLLSN